MDAITITVPGNLRRSVARGLAARRDEIEREVGFLALHQTPPGDASAALFWSDPQPRMDALGAEWRQIVDLLAEVQGTQRPRLDAWPRVVAEALHILRRDLATRDQGDTADPGIS